MTNIYDEIINGKLELLYELTDLDRKSFVSNIIENSHNKKEILNKLLPIFQNSNNWYFLAYEIFKLIYLDNDYKEYTFYLLHNEYVKLVDLKNGELKIILESTTWGFDYVLHNLKKYLDHPKINSILNILIRYTEDNSISYEMLKERIMSYSVQEVRDNFAYLSVINHLNITEDDIKAILYRDPNDYYYHQETLPFYKEISDKLTKSDLPNMLLFFIRTSGRYAEMYIKDFDLFFTTEKTRKMAVLGHFYDYLSEETREKYSSFYKLYKKQPTAIVDKYISAMINDDIDFFNKLLKSQQISYITSGSTTHVFRIGDIVLKFTREKHEKNTKKDLFLIAPTSTKIIYDKHNNPILTVEIQKYLDKTINGKMMTEEDIDNFFNELYKQGYVLTDPHCLQRRFDNFGFLEDYHEANLGNLSSYEELPEWFKERPIVLYDVDLVYKKDDIKKKTFTL